MGKILLKCVLVCLFSTKHKEINISHSDVQNMKTLKEVCFSDFYGNCEKIIAIMMSFSEVTAFCTAHEIFFYIPLQPRTFNVSLFLFLYISIL